MTPLEENKTSSLRREGTQLQSSADRWRLRTRERGEKLIILLAKSHANWLGRSLLKFSFITYRQLESVCEPPKIWTAGDSPISAEGEHTSEREQYGCGWLLITGALIDVKSDEEKRIHLKYLPKNKCNNWNPIKLVLPQLTSRESRAWELDAGCHRLKLSGSLEDARISIASVWLSTYRIVWLEWEVHLQVSWSAQLEFQTFGWSAVLWRR